MSANTIRLHRVLRTTPEIIGRFSMPTRWASGLPPNGFTGKVHHMDAKVGGTYKMSFTNFSTGKSHRSAESTSNWSPTSAFDTPTDSMTRTCRARCR